MIRENKKVTLKELSVRTKISKQYLIKIEAGKACSLTINKIFAIAFALKTEPYLFFERV